MKPTTREWVDKAEADFTVALLLRKSRKRHTRDILCFHLQQCVEKYLKGRLEEASVVIPKTQDVLRLLDLNQPHEPLWATLRPGISTISTYAVDFRYPGRTTSIQEAHKLLKATEHIREMVRFSLGL